MSTCFLFALLLINAVGAAWCAASGLWYPAAIGFISCLAVAFVIGVRGGERP